MPNTLNGYDLPSKDDEKEKVDNKFKQEFNDNINLSDGSVLGMFSNIIADYLYYDDEKLGYGVYNSLFILKSNGQALDDNLADHNIFRKPASNAYTTLQIDGYFADGPTEIPIGTEFSTDDGHVFKTLDDANITQQANVKNATGSPVQLNDGEGNPLGRASVQAISEETGTDENVLPSTILQCDESIDGLFAVTNPNGASGGADAETDDALKQRYMRSMNNITKGTRNALEASILGVNGVQDCRVIDNKDIRPDKYGNPAKSVHCYVIGGNDSDIASAIDDQLYLTTPTVGNKKVKVTDYVGDTQIISFDEAPIKPIYISINLKIDNTVFNTDNAPDAIKQKVISYFNALSMGDSVLYSRIFAPAFSQPGVIDASIKLGTNSNDLNEQNVNVGEFELPKIDTNNIYVNW